MAILRTKEIRAMDKKARMQKMNDLKLELIKASMRSNKNNAKTKEIKRAIARIITLNKLEGKNLLKSK